MLKHMKVDTACTACCQLNTYHRADQSAHCRSIDHGISSHLLQRSDSCLVFLLQSRQLRLQSSDVSMTCFTVAFHSLT